jgi:hypothetical protein
MRIQLALDEAWQRVAPGDRKRKMKKLRRLFSVQTTIGGKSGIGNDFDDVGKDISVM